MKSRKHFFWNLSIFCVLSLMKIQSSNANESKIKFDQDFRSDIYAYQLERLCELDGNGIYDKAMNKLGFKYKVLPAVRADILMMKENACVFPVDMRYMKRDKPLIHSNPLFIVNIKIYSKYKPFKDLKDLINKRVGIRRGLSLGQNVVNASKKFKVEYVDTLEQNMRKLEYERVDAVIEFELDVLEYIKTNTKFQITYDKKHNVDRLQESIVCVDTEKNRDLIKRFNTALDKNKNIIPELMNQELVSDLRYCIDQTSTDVRFNQI